MYVLGSGGKSLLFMEESPQQDISFILIKMNLKNIRTERLDRQNGAAPNIYAFYSSSQLKILQEQYRRLRDISVISFLGFYLLQVIDANVEANLFLFDTDDNLSLKMDIKNYNGTPQLFIPSLTFTFRFNNKMLIKTHCKILCFFVIRLNVLWTNTIYV